MLRNDMEKQADDRGKEVNLIDLFIFLLKYKRLILFCIILAGISTPLYLTVSARFKAKIIDVPQEQYYYAECIISHSDITRIKYFLQSRDLTIKVMQDNHLPMIRHNVWDDKASKWVTEHLYAWDDKNKTLTDEKFDSKSVSDSIATLYIKPQQNTITMSFSSREKDETIRLLTVYLNHISEFHRKYEIAILKEQRGVYEKKFAVAKDSYQKAQLAQKLIEMSDRELLTRNLKYFGFELIDSPYITNVIFQPQKQIESVPMPSARKYIAMTFLLMLAAFVIALFLAGAMEYLAFIKKSDPAKFNLLLKQLEFGDPGKKQI